MSLMRSEPADTLVPLGQAMNRLLEMSFFGLGQFDMFGRTLPLDIRETEQGFIVEAAVPGVAPEDLHVSVSGDLLTIFAKRRTEEDKEDTRCAYIRRERYEGPMYRSVKLPTAVDADTISAAYEQGVLTVHLPMATTARPIQVTVSAKELTHVS